MTRPLYYIGRFCCRHHYPVIGAWGLLERTVPHISIEDDSFFKQRDAAAAARKPASGG